MVSAADTKGITMQKLSTAPFRAAKKTERKVGKGKGKGKGKETRPGSCKNPLRPRGRARYAEAGAAADELIDILGGNSDRDRGTWAYYCYHHDTEIILDKAHEIASLRRQGELDNPVTAFQHWLQVSYAKD